ncbi:MAG: hypothetical protein KDA45_02030 [Planctomycetales bacterium]|nr:hypothetical protein [Planctomycetales bacterium]
MILLVTKDLFFVPTLRAAADKCGVELVTALSFDSARVQGLPPEGLTACVLDLSGIPVAGLAEVVSELRGRFPQARLVAFGPHVQEQRLHAAREAGCQPVLTRGQLSSHIDRLMADWTLVP